MGADLHRADRAGDERIVLKLARYCCGGGRDRTVPCVGNCFVGVVVLLLYAVAMFVGATLLFLVQPLFARMALPLLGGSPAVWNTAMLFYQMMLLAGYCYAHVITRVLQPRAQAALHGALLLLPLLVLPIGVPEGWRPPAESSPVWWFLGLLTVAVGLPFFVVSATSPLLQAWFARTGHARAVDPYPLYAASNVGSMLALLAYPTLLEPALRLGDQSRLWAAGYVVLAGLILGCAVVVWRTENREPRTESRESRTENREPRAENREQREQNQKLDVQNRTALFGSEFLVLGSRLTPGRRARWALLAFVPSSLMLSVTAYLSTNIAPIPLLWTLPLALYLLTFILVFGGEVFPHGGMVRALPIVVLPLVIVMAAQATAPLELLLPLHLLVFFVAAMVCHGELARDRPPAGHLTEFYLWLSVGGALGGVFNALLAPVLFDSVLEYPLVLVVACLLNAEGRTLNAEPNAEGSTLNAERVRAEVPSHSLHATGIQLQGLSVQRSAFRLWDFVLPAALGLLTAALVLGAQRFGLGTSPAGLGVMFGVPSLLCFAFSRRPLRFGLGVAAILLASGLYVSDQGRPLYAERTFFGIHRVLLDASGRFHLLAHGPTLHGVQGLDPASRRTPLSYYYPSGPAGQVFAVLGPSRRNIAAVGLGVGSLACYREPGQRWTFYEIDAAVERIARDERFFSVLAECGGDTPVVLGDARLTLADAPAGAYDLLVMDAYTSDAVPVHLLTREALALYLEKLAPGGVVAFHISNQYFDLRPVLAGLAQDAGLAAMAQDDVTVSAAEAAAGKRGSQWVVLARDRHDFGALADDPRWYTLEVPGAPLWTDDYSSVLSVLKLR
jgi:spermidine synthase